MTRQHQQGHLSYNLDNCIICGILEHFLKPAEGYSVLDMELKLLEKFINQQLEELQARDIVTLNVTDLTTVADKLIICQGRSPRHVKSIASNLIEKLKKNDSAALSHSGIMTGEWVLVDCGDIVVHVMLPEIRAFYNLEGLWQPETSEKKPVSEN